MRLMRRLVPAVTLLAAALILTSCSPDGSGTINGPLDRKEGIVEGPEINTGCVISARNIFEDPAGLPFTVDCEDMNNAVHSIVFEEYNGSGCITSVRGNLEFPSTGHKYSYVAARERCSNAGASMTVCGGTLRNCQTFALPTATAIDVRQVRGASK